MGLFKRARKSMLTPNRLGSCLGFSLVIVSLICMSVCEMWGLGSIGDAQKLFDEMGERDLCSWNTMIFGYAKVGKLK
jgi:hypothetical protein